MQESEGLVAIRRFGGLLYFLVGLRQVLLRFSGMTAHVKLICALRGVNLANGLLNEALRGKQIGMAAWTDILAD
jgi:hypothetical protein